MKTIAILLIVLAVFAASPLALDERVCGYGQVLPIHEWTASASDGEEPAANAIDFAPFTYWVGARAESTRWTVSLPAPTWLTGVQIDIGNYHGWTYPAEGVGISLDGGATLTQQVDIETFFDEWLRFRFEPRKTKTLSLQIFPWKIGNEGKWSLFDVRLFGAHEHDVSRPAFVASLPSLALPLAATLAWLLWLRLGARRRDA